MGDGQIPRDCTYSQCNGYATGGDRSTAGRGDLLSEGWRCRICGDISLPDPCVLTVIPRCFTWKEMLHSVRVSKRGSSVISALRLYVSPILRTDRHRAETSGYTDPYTQSTCAACIPGYLLHVAFRLSFSPTGEMSMWVPWGTYSEHFPVLLESP